MSGAPFRLAGPLVRRGLDFLLRHRWSLPLSLTSTALLLYLAEEMREGDLAGIDAVVFHAVQAWRGSLDGLMLAFTLVGGGVGMTVVCVAMLIVLWLTERQRAALFMATAGTGTFILSTGLKLLFHRARPLEGYLIPAPSSFSFPSGHAMGSMGVLASSVVVLYAVGAPRLLRRIATLVSGLFVFGVALSRVYFGVHYFSDVVGGQLAAAAWVSALTGWFYPRLFPGEESVTAPGSPGPPRRPSSPRRGQG
jgi:membrane-associated phospholipid phosphatase